MGKTKDFSKDCKNIVLNLFKFFQLEKARGRPFYSPDNLIKRTCHYLVTIPIFSFGKKNQITPINQTLLTITGVQRSKSSRAFFLSVCWIQEDFYRLQLYTHNCKICQQPIARMGKTKDLSKDGKNIVLNLFKFLQLEKASDNPHL
jgi:hypothetical protein